MSAENLVRFGVSVDKELFTEFERVITEKGYTNRSEAIRDLMRDFLLAEKLNQRGNDEVVGTITLIYNHHVRDLSDRLTALQHEYYRVIISSLHVHLDHEKCLEVLVVRGDFKTVQLISGRLLSIKGVLSGKLITSGVL